MHEGIAAAFIALSSRAKILILARTIHMETIHVRAIHLQDPNEVSALYQSSEFIHRLSGFIMSLSHEVSCLENRWSDAAMSLIEGVASHGPNYLDMLSKWISEAEAP